MAECYTATIKNCKRESKRKLLDMQRAYDSLTNKNTEYARDIKAIIDIYKSVDEIYANTPIEI
jgi:hypothetical protein